MAGIKQNRQKDLIFIAAPKHRKQLIHLVLLMQGGCSYKDNDNSDKSKKQ